MVACALGRLYNKDTIIEFLLGQSSYGEGEVTCTHIRSLKVRTSPNTYLRRLILSQDVKQLKLTPNVAASTQDDSLNRASFVCPLTLKEMNGSQPFVYISTCGCVFSQAGLKTVTSSSPKDKEKGKGKDDSGSTSPPTTTQASESCPQCGKAYNAKEDVILLNPSPDDEYTLRMNMERKRAAEPSKKKSKKRKNDSPDADDAAPPTKKAAPAPSLKPSMAAASRALVSGLAVEEAKRKANMTDAVKSLYSTGTNTTKETFMTRGTFTRVRCFHSHFATLLIIFPVCLALEDCRHCISIV